MNSFLRKLALYARLPEMQAFWVFLPFLLVLFIINAIYLPPMWTFLSSVIIFILGAALLFNSLRLAQSNLEVKIERNELKSIIANLLDGVVAYDRSFRILVVNRAAEAIFGLKESDILNRQFTLESARDPRYKVFSQVMFSSLAPVVMRRSQEGAYPQIVDIILEEPHMELRVVTDRIVDPAGALLGYLKIVRDRTRETALLRSKTDFITTAAHQLRTPLTSLHWSLESIAQSAPEELKEPAQVALTSSQRLLKIVNDLLDVSKMEEGKFGYQFQETDIIALIERVLADKKPFAEQNKVNLYFAKPEEPMPKLTVDANKIAIAISNLVDNAVLYNVENGEITVSLAPLSPKPYVEIRVKDTGMGIPEDEMPKLFTKFFRAKNVAETVTSGSGLGLYIVYNIVRRHGGNIRAESQLNRGTTFFLTLPTDPNLISRSEIIDEEA